MSEQDDRGLRLFFVGEPASAIHIKCSENEAQRLVSLPVLEYLGSDSVAITGLYVSNELHFRMASVGPVNKTTNKAYDYGWWRWSVFYMLRLRRSKCCARYQGENAQLE